MAKIRRRRIIADPDVQELSIDEEHNIIDSIITSINKACGDESALSMRDFDDVTSSRVRQWIPSGFRWLDMAMSQGRGLPCGKIIEMYGLESTGKTALCQYLIKHYQKNRGSAVYIDFETSLDKDHLVGYGLDLGNLAYVSVETVEDGFDALMAILDNLAALPAEDRDRPVLIIWDSVAMAPPKAESNEDSHDKSHIGLLARAMSKGMRKVRRKVSKTNCTIIFTNQGRIDIGVTYGDKLTVPGGKALRFASSIRMKLVKVKTMSVTRKGIRKPTGYIIEVDVKKTRFAPPHQKAQFILSFKKGPDPDASFLHYLKTIGLIRKAGRMLVFTPTGDKMQPREWKAYYTANRKEIKKALKEREDSLFVCEDGTEDESDSVQGEHNGQEV